MAPDAGAKLRRLEARAHLYFLHPMPLVTVIVNLYNGEATVAEAIDSVLAQTFSDWELLIWDDCSTDGSADIVHRYTDARIRYVRSDTWVSLGQARQAAIDLARGEWIAFLDQDDLWLPDKLERQLAAGSRQARRCTDLRPRGSLLSERNGARLRPGARVHAAA